MNEFYRNLKDTQTEKFGKLNEWKQIRCDNQEEIVV